MRFVADENFDGTILRELHKHFPNLDVLRLQDTELYQQADSVVLEWAAEQKRIVLTHDVQTLVNEAYSRVEQGLAMPGVILVRRRLAIGAALDDLLLIMGASEPEEFENRVIFVPL